MAGGLRLLLGVCMVLPCGPGCRGGAQPAAGDAGTIGPGFRVAVRAVRSCPAARLFPAPAGHHWLGVDLEIEATGPTRIPANPFYARLEDARGHDVPSRPGPCEPALRHAPLLQGRIAHGWVSFVVKDQPGELVLHYAPHLPGRVDAEATIKLGAS